MQGTQAYPSPGTGFNFLFDRYSVGAIAQESNCQQDELFKFAEIALH
jgi:hypothetical protein